MSKWAITGVTIITPEEEIENAKLTVKNSKFETIGDDESDAAISISVKNGVLMPGLINSHDHLLGTYYPKVGNGPYENWLPWDNDLKSSPVYTERQQIENRDLYLLGGYRSLVSGATSVSDHIPHFVQDPFIDLLPVRVLKDFALAHSIGPYALAWGDGIHVEYQKAIKDDLPFITHIAEGFDPLTRQDIKTLDHEGGLGEHSVLIHGLAFSDDDIKLIKERDASVVWCGDSNMFMFNKTANIKKLIETGVNVCIGTDSPMSGGENILYEMKHDKALYKRLYKEELADEMIVKMTTVNAAKAFRQKKLGKIETGYTADFVVFTNNENNSYKSVVNSRLRDVQLVVIDGKPSYGNIEFSDLFDSLKIEYQTVKIDGVRKVIVGDIIGLIKRIQRAVGFKKEFPFLPIEFD